MASKITFRFGSGKPVPRLKKSTRTPAYRKMLKAMSRKKQ